MQIKTKIVSCHTADSKPVKQEANGTVILPPLVVPASPLHMYWLLVFPVTLAQLVATSLTLGEGDMIRLQGVTTSTLQKG